MPSEPFLWDRRRRDRKDLRKFEVAGGGGGGGGGYCGPRWREGGFQYGGGGGGGGGGSRWLPDFRYRNPNGHIKQGGRHLYHDEFGHGFAPSRSNDKMLDGESFRPSGSGRYGKNSRENRESFGQRDSKVHSAECSPQPNGPGRPNNLSEQRSVDMKPSFNYSRPSPNLTNARDPSHPKNQHDTDNGVVTAGSTCQELERDNTLDSIDWKPIKWTRSGSLSSRGSCYNHSISSNRMALESSEVNLESIQKDVASVQFPSVDAAAGIECVAPVGPLEQTESRKKPRLGFGEGLAKYEKKVIGVEDSINNGANGSTNNSQLGHSFSSSLTDKSPRLVGLPDCASPVTPVAHSSSPGLEEKEPVNIGSSINDGASKHKSPSVLPLDISDQSPFNLENVDETLISHLSSSISEVLQSDDPSSVGPSFMRSSAMNKLVVLKNDISKALETTESEIDMLENELKSLFAVPESNHCLGDSISVLDQCSSKPCEDHSAVSYVSSRPTALQLDLGSSDSPKDDNIVLNDVDVDSPGSATSKFNESSSSGKDVCSQLHKGVKVLDCSDVNESITEIECLVDNVVEETSSGFSSAGESASSDDDNFQRGRCDFSYESLVASNRECAHSLSEEFKKLLPSNEYHFDFSSIVSASCVENDNVKESFLRKKNDIQLKEKILTLKFKMFGHLCREDRQLQSLKKLRTKSQKKFDFSLQRGNCYLKLRTSVRPQCSPNGGTGGGRVPSLELVNYARRLLAEPQVKPHRSVLKMPSMILDAHDRMRSIFISNNNLVEDPYAVEEERSLLSLWSTEEEEKFIDKLAIVGKDFGQIATYFDNKTTADCIEFYYKNHKSEAFERAKKKPKFSDRAKACSASTYLITSGERRNREANAASLDMLGAASAIVASVDEGVAIKPYLMSRNFKMTTGVDNFVERLKNLDVCNSERETVAADVLAGICGSLSSEAMSSCITSSVDPGEGFRERKHQRIGSVSRRPLVPDVIENVDDGSCSDESCGEVNSSDWTDEEKALLIQAVSSYGRDFSKISRCVRTRSRDQCKVFFSKSRKCLGLDSILRGQRNLITVNVNGGGSDEEDACTVQTGSIICSEKSELKTQEEDNVSNDKVSTDEKLGLKSAEVEGITLQPDLNKALVANEAGDVGSTDKELTTKGSSSVDHMVDDSEMFIDDDNRNCADTVLDIDGLHLSRNTGVETSSISKRKFTSASTMEEMNSVVGVKNQVPDAMHAARQMGRDSYLQRCNGSRPSAGNNADMVKPPTSTDVKLFGQILSKPSQQKSDSDAYQGEGTIRQHRVSNGSKNDCYGFGGSENCPPRDFGFRDQGMMNHGFSSSPNSAFSLAKYPTVSTKCAPSFKVEDHSPSNGVGKIGECSLNGISVFPTRYQESQPFTIGTRQRLQEDNLFSRNGSDVLSGMQQTVPRDMAGANVGRRAVLAGGHYASISDPVAAIRMHYAKSEQFSGHTGSVIAEDESWCGKGNPGR